MSKAVHLVLALSSDQRFSKRKNLRGLVYFTVEETEAQILYMICIRSQNQDSNSDRGRRYEVTGFNTWEVLNHFI